MAVQAQASITGQRLQMALAFSSRARFRGPFSPCGEKKTELSMPRQRACSCQSQ
jgi:hypothetical protein